MQQEGVFNSGHYLDDFLVWGRLHLPNVVRRGRRPCVKGWDCQPLNTKSGPHNNSDVLGIEIDSVALVLRLPADKLGHPRRTLASWESKRHAFKHELQVLIGLLNHMATVTRPGCTFIRQLIVASKLPRRQSHMQGSAKCGLPVEPSVVGLKWRGSRVLCRSDNQAVVACLTSKTARNPHLAHLLRCPFFFEAQYNFEHAQHIAGPLCTPSGSRRTGRSAMGQGDQLDHSALERLVRGYFVKGIARRTLNTNSLTQRRYLAFCQSYQILPLPLSETSVCLFVCRQQLVSSVQQLVFQLQCTCSFQTSAALLQFMHVSAACFFPRHCTFGASL